MQHCDVFLLTMNDWKQNSFRIHCTHVLVYADPNGLKPLKDVAPSAFIFVFVIVFCIFMTDNLAYARDHRTLAAFNGVIRFLFLYFPSHRNNNICALVSTDRLKLFTTKAAISNGIIFSSFLFFFVFFLILKLLTVKALFYVWDLKIPFFYSANFIVVYYRGYHL